MQSLRCSPCAARVSRAGCIFTSKLPRQTKLVFLRRAVESDKDGGVQETQPAKESSFSDDEIRKLAELRRQGQAKAQSSNLVQGAIEEAGLITWPSPKKAVLDTVLVLAIVAGTSFLLLAVNVSLNNLSEAWYHTRS